jgi:Predicted beta-xylosidase
MLLVEQRADPYIYRHSDGYYYFTASVPEYDRIELRRSWTLAGLSKAEPCVVWRKHAEGPMSWHIWAPELHYIDGAWYLYFAAGRAGDIWYIRTWILRNKSADPFVGTWEELGQLETEWDSFTLDSTSFEHKGSRYLVWAQKAVEREENSRLYIARMSSPTKLELPQTLVSKPEYDWECSGYKVNEGAAALLRNGKVFISYSASATDANYCMGLIWADAEADLLDPKSWHKEPRPVLVTDPEKSVFGPGHNSFTVDESGGRDVFVYHARPYREVSAPLYDPNRHAMLGSISYDERGFPQFHL